MTGGLPNAAAAVLGDFALMVVFALTPLPAEVAALAIALRHPFWLALALIWTGGMVGALLGYGLMRTSKRLRAWVLRWNPIREAEAKLRDLGWVGILGLRLIPIVPFSALSLAAGLLRLPLGGFLAGTALGIIPATLTLTLIGRGLMSENAGQVIAAVGGGVALLVLALLLRYRRLW